MCIRDSSIIESDHPGADSEEDGYGFDLHYYKNGMDLQRSYFVNSDFFQKNKTYKRVYESREFKDFYSIKNLKKIHQSELSICSAFQYNDLPLSKEDKKEIVVCLEKDFYNRTYEEQMDPCHPYGTVNLTYKVILPEEGSYLDGIMFNILRSDKHTIRWLNDHGYSAEFEPSAKDVESLQVYTCAPSELETILREEDYMNPQFSSYYKKAGDIRNAVSYTHLDVYKRQARFPGRLLLPPLSPCKTVRIFWGSLLPKCLFRCRIYRYRQTSDKE